MIKNPTITGEFFPATATRMSFTAKHHREWVYARTLENFVLTRCPTGE
jgi:hypothetical protein